MRPQLKIHAGRSEKLFFLALCVRFTISLRSHRKEKIYQYVH